MKALSIKQPWAWAIAAGHKTIETRTWPTKHRGELLIVASKQPDKDMMKWFEDNKPAGFSEHLEYGKAIAVSRLTDCRPMTDIDGDAAMCDRYEGAFSWFLRNIRKIEPFEVKGQLGIYEVDCKPVFMDESPDNSGIASRGTDPPGPGQIAVNNAKIDEQLENVRRTMKIQSGPVEFVCSCGCGKQCGAACYMLRPGRVFRAECYELMMGKVKTERKRNETKIQGVG